MQYIILDLEATCWEKRPQGYSNEIIEIGAVKVNENREIIDEFAQFIRPLKQPILSDFCTKLTSIVQEQVDSAAYFPEVLADFHNWIGIPENTNYYLCSWGFYDRSQFTKDCVLHDLDTDWLKPHISLKHQYTGIAGLTKNIGMKRALDNEGITLKGTHHRGIDDARNIVQIFLNRFEKWNFPSIT